MRKIPIIIFSALLMGASFAGCTHKATDKKVEIAAKDYTRENLLEEVKGSELISFSTEDDGTVTNVFSNGATATISNGKAYIENKGRSFEYNLEEYVEAVGDKQLKVQENAEETIATTVKESVAASEKATEKEETKPVSTTGETTTAKPQVETQETHKTNGENGKWVTLDDGRTKYVYPEEIFTFEDGNGNVTEFTWDEWQEFLKTGAMPQ